LSARASTERPDLDEIAEDNDFAVITTKKKQSKTKIKLTIIEAAINTALPSAPSPESHVPGSSDHKKNQFLTAPRQKIPPVVIHHHFQGDMTKINKGFHSNSSLQASQPIECKLV
jgi:hypothetical protein